MPWQEMGGKAACAVQRCHGRGSGVPQRGDSSSALGCINRWQWSHSRFLSRQGEEAEGWP